MRLLSSPTSILLGGLLGTLVGTAYAAYDTIESRFNSNHSIRVKTLADGELCNGGGKHYAGWADMGDRHLFYWYHPARHSAAKDAPLLIWLQGGPGGSSVVGMLAENGPCLMDADANSTHYNPDAWTESFNVIYLDQPAGVGFSYIDHPEDEESYPRRSEESALDFIVAVKLFQEAFEELANVPVHIAGESYAGKYIPEYGAAVLEYNSHVPAASRIPLASLMIGNGLTSTRQQYPTLYETGCFEQHSIAPIFNASQCAAMAAVVDRCETLLDLCDQHPDEIVCSAAGQYCEQLVKTIEQTLVNKYDRTIVCPGVGDCYPLIDHIFSWLNADDVWQTLEITEQSGGRKTSFEVESTVINRRYIESADYFISAVPALQKVLGDANVHVLYYVGVQDWICNPLGTARMLDSVRWAGHAQFRGEKLKPLPWKTKEGKVAGYMRSVEGLWLVELNGAGHLVPFNQPHSSLILVQLWLKSVESRRLLGGISREMNLGGSREQYPFDIERA